MPAASNRRARLSEAARGDVRQVARPPRQVQGGRVGGGQRLQVVDHAGQPQHLIAQRGQLAGVGSVHPVQQRLVAGLQHRDRRAQLVGDVGDQVAADLVFAVRACRPSGRRPRPGRAARPGARTGPPARRGRRPPWTGSPRSAGDRAGDPPGHRQAGQQGQQRRQPGRARDGLQQRGPQQGVGGAEAGAGEPDQSLPRCWPWTTTGALERRCRVGGETGGGRPRRARPCRGSAASTPLLAARSSSGDRSADAQLSFRSHAAPAATATALARRCAAGRPATRRPRRRRRPSARPAAPPPPAPRQEGQREPQPERVAAGRRAPGRDLSHRGPGPAGTRRPARSG